MIRFTILANCGASDEYAACDWVDENLWDGIFGPIVAGTVSWEIFAALVTIPLAIGLVSWSRSTYLPAVVLALLASVALSTVPGNLAAIAGRLLVAIFAFLLVVWWMRLR